MSAPSQPTVKPHWPWPDHLDAMTAAPDHHRLVFENERMRVLDTVIPPGDIVPVHHHRWPAIYYVIVPGDFIRRDPDGNVLFDSRTATEKQTPFSASWLECLPPHSVENVSPHQIHVVNVELKD
jgi:hypothetical protein